MKTSRLEPERPSKADVPPETRAVDPEVDYPTETTDIVEFGYGEDEEAEPIPVYLVEAPPAAYELIRWSSDRFTLQDDAVMVAGDNRNRKSVVIVNHDAANDVFVSPEQSNARAFFGKIAAGAALELSCNTRVYALCDANLTAEISVFQEYVISE